MLLNIFLIAIAIAITILSTTELRKDEETKWHKKLTRNGIIFYIAILSAVVFQIIKEFQSSNREFISNNKINNLVENLDSVKRMLYFSSDTIGNLRDSISKLIRIINLVGDKSSSIESQLYLTDKKVSSLGKTNDSVNKRILESDRPIISIASAQIKRNEFFLKKYSIDFLFVNSGKRPATNFYGNAYSMYKDTVSDLGTLRINRSDILVNDQGFTYHYIMTFNPDSISLDEPIYFYFTISYSDLILGTSYNYEIPMKLSPYNKGNYLKFLVLCPSWEIEEMKRTIKIGSRPGNK